MSWEIEFKARVRDWNQTKAALDTQARFLESYLKKDQYFQHPLIPQLKGQGGLFRVREYNQDFWVTQKEKTLLEGMEESKENEFQVDGPCFLLFLRNLGFRISLEKTKEGLRYDFQGVCAELSHVSDLGDFLELEILLPDQAEDSQRSWARKKILESLGALGLSEQDVEPKTYSQLYDELEKLK